MTLSQFEPNYEEFKFPDYVAMPRKKVVFEESEESEEYIPVEETDLPSEQISEKLTEAIVERWNEATRSYEEGY